MGGYGQPHPADDTRMATKAHYQLRETLAITLKRRRKSQYDIEVRLIQEW